MEKDWYGFVNQVCEKINYDENCDYVMKIQRFYNPVEDAKSSMNEVNMMNIASKFTPSLSPFVKEFYISSYYSIIISEKMDLTMYDVLDMIHGKPSWNDVLSYTLDVILHYVTELHQQGMVHCDLHFGNIMFKLPSGSDLIKEKNKWNKSPIIFARGLENGSIIMKFIDYGLASIKEDIENKMGKKLKFYENGLVIENLKKIGCISENDTIGASAFGVSKIPYKIPYKFFDILEFYDIACVLDMGMGETTGNAPVMLKILNEEKRLKGSSECRVGARFE